MAQRLSKGDLVTGISLIKKESVRDYIIIITDSLLEKISSRIRN